MSNRFYVNGVQIFGNNEMFPETYNELKKQGAEWTDDGTFDEIEITNPQALMRAVELDIFKYLKEVATENVIDKVNKKVHKHIDFSKVHDTDLFWSDFEDDLKSCIYTEDGEIETNTWRYLIYFINEKRVFTPYILFQAIENDITIEGNQIRLKEGHTITAEMY